MVQDPKDRERSCREARRLWYRAPELLLRKAIYSFEIDIWAFGCILAELAINYPLFPAEREIDQLFKIFALVGAPDQENWASLNDSSNFKPMFPNWPSVYFSDIARGESSVEFAKLKKTLLPRREHAFKTLKVLSERVGADGLDLIWQCLQIDPQRRPSVDAILNHKFFADMNFQTISKMNLSLSKDASHFPATYTVPLMPEKYIVSYFKELRERETGMKCLVSYFGNQAGFTEQMRCILIDWLIDVSVHFNVTDETLHYCVNYIDRALGALDIDKNKVQLVGVTCMKIAE